MAKNLRVRLLAAATVNGKRSYYKPATRSTGWPDPGAVLVKGRKVRIDAFQRHAYYVTWLEGKKQKLFQTNGVDARMQIKIPSIMELKVLGGSPTPSVDYSSDLGRVYARAVLTCDGGISDFGRATPLYPLAER